MVYWTQHAQNPEVHLAGNNPGCDTPGFNATTGWDPVRTCLQYAVKYIWCKLTDALAFQVSGAGSPVYAKLRAAAGL